MRKVLIHIIAFLYRLTIEKITVDGINSKVIMPVEGLIIDGKQYYEFKSVSDMPQNRFIHYLDFRGESEMNIPRSMILEYLKQIKEANNTADSSRIGSLVYMLEDSVANCTSLELLYNLSTLIYFTRDEDLSCYDLDYNQDKVAGFKTHPDKSFFLRRLLERSLKVTGEMSPGDIDSYLRKSMVKLRVYEQMLTSGSDTKTENDLKSSSLS